MNITKINRIRIAAIAIIFVVAAVAGFVFFFNQLRTKSKAAPAGTATLSLVAVNNPPMDSGGGIRIGVDLNPNGVDTDLYAFDIQVVYDSNKLDFYNDSGIAANVFLAGSELKQQITRVDSNTIRIVGTRIGKPIDDKSQRIAEITFKLKSGQTFPLTFSWGNTQLQTPHLINVPLTLADNSSGVSSSSTSSTGSQVALSFTPGAPSYEVGNLVMVDVMLNTAGKQIGSTAVSFSYDQNKLTYVSTTINAGIFNGATSAPAPSGGVITLQAARNGGISGLVKVATIKFTAKALGSANLIFNQPPTSWAYVNGTTTNVLASVNPSAITIVTAGNGTSSAGAGFTSSSGSGGGTPGEHVESNGDILHINSLTFDQAPLRYEQVVKLSEGDYILSGAARVYTARGRGVQVALACGEASCGDGKKLNDIFVKTPSFAISADFQMKEATVHISGNQKDKKLVVRMFVEDGSEADFDYVSLMDVWGGQHLTNYHFGELEKVVSPRSYPQYWNMDAAGQIFSTVDKQQGVDGSLFINSSSRK